MEEIHELKLQVDRLIPEKCEGCAVQCELKTEMLKLLVTKEVVLEIGEGLMGEFGEHIDNFIDENMPEEDAGDIKHFIRQGSVDTLDEIYESTSKLEDQISANSRSCVGPLKMRATKNGVTYTASICTSQTQYVRGGKQNHIPTHIKTI